MFFKKRAKVGERGIYGFSYRRQKFIGLILRHPLSFGECFSFFFFFGISEFFYFLSSALPSCYSIKKLLVINRCDSSLKSFRKTSFCCWKDLSSSCIELRLECNFFKFVSQIFQKCCISIGNNRVWNSFILFLFTLIFGQFFSVVPDCWSVCSPSLGYFFDFLFLFRFLLLIFLGWSALLLVFTRFAWYTLITFAIHRFSIKAAFHSLDLYQLPFDCRFFKSGFGWESQS